MKAQNLKRQLSNVRNAIDLVQFVIPGLTRNPVFFWIPRDFTVLDGGE